MQNEIFNQDWDSFYYKMYYQMLKGILNPRNTYNIFVDIKDTNGAIKRQKLQEVLNNLKNDAQSNKQMPINFIQAVRSHEVELIQLADLLIGAVCYVNRGLEASKAKLKIIELLKEETSYPLTATTFLNENKFNSLDSCDIFKVKYKHMRKISIVFIIILISSFLIADAKEKVVQTPCSNKSQDLEMFYSDKNAQINPALKTGLVYSEQMEISELLNLSSSK